MPIPEEMGEKVRGNSKVADLAQHNTERWGGASYAAAFLREFVDDVPWAHIDIAGPAFNDKAAHGHVTPGGIVYQGDTYPEQYRNQFIAGNLLSSAIYWHVLEPKGSTFTARSLSIRLPSFATK